ncbi:DUF4430 domain-containing protein [Cellulosilyticum sp. WCF-2]|nr:DUF4430 domain-containing protein [Cellulosilyticum sp. WCF-2]
MDELPTVSQGIAEIITEPSNKSFKEDSLNKEILKSSDSSNEVETPTPSQVGDNPLKESKETEKSSSVSKSTETDKPQSTPQPVTVPQSTNQIDTNTGKDKYLTDPVPEGKPLPIEPQNTKITDKSMTCTLSVSCSTILDNINNLDKEKIELVPEDGVIFKATEVIFYEGESVFNVLQREMKKNKIHMEFVNTPIYNSAYIEGINNLYEFDCGELSGWMYKVNGWFPNYGCSRYQLKEGDVIEWVYTCDLGRDVGDQYYSIEGGE